MNKEKAYILIGHLSFWFICVFTQVLLSENDFLLDLLSVGVYSIGFYLNYFVVLPLMPKRKPQQGLLLSLSLYLIISVSQIYPLYTLFDNYFIPMEIVGKGHQLGGILHLAFFFYAISSLSRLMITKYLKDQKKHKNTLKSVNKNIDKIRGEMSFNFTSSVLSELHKHSFMNPNYAADPIMKLSRVLRYKLHKSESENTLLSDEIKIITQYLELINLNYQNNWKVILRDDSWITTGSALKKVEDLIQSNTLDGGTILISADEDDLWVTVK